MLIQPTTLADTGWLPYWDSAGHNPILPGDTFEITPGGTLDICYINRPEQKEDGQWYGKRVYMYEPFPGLIGGMYSKSRIYSNATLAGVDEDLLSLRGRIEEISFWGKAIEEATMVNYQTNLTGMIGEGIGDMYEDVSAAEADSLYVYFKFDSASQLAQNYNTDGAIAAKTSIFDVGSGKTSNANILDGPTDYILIEQMKSEREISMNIRFYVENKEDFVLFENKQIIKIKYLETIEKFKITLIPYIGNGAVYYIEIGTLVVHHWYDFGVIYREGILTVIVDGIKIEDNTPNILLGGVEKLKAEMKNVESVSIGGIDSGIVFTGYYNPYNIWSDDEDNESSKLGNIIINDIVITHSITPGSPVVGQSIPFKYGGDNAMNILVDRDELRGVCSSISLPLNTPEVLVAEEISNSVSAEFLTRRHVYRAATTMHYLSMSVKIKENYDNSFDIIYSNYTDRQSYSTSYSYASYRNLFIGNQLDPGNVYRLRIKFKDILIDDSPIFPMLTFFPGTRIKVNDYLLSPPSDSFYNQLLDAGEIGYYWKHETSTTSTNLTTYPAIRNITGTNLVVKIENTSGYVYLNNGSVLYFIGETAYVVTYDYRYRHVYPDSSAFDSFGALIFDVKQG